MKKLFSILLVSLLCALTASAEGPHRIRIKVLPEGAVKFTVRYQGDVDERGRSVDRFSSDTLAVFEDVAEPGTRIYIYCSHPTGYVKKSWMQNGLPIETGSYSSIDYIMPDEDVELVGMYEYDPGAPTYQPGAGNWDPETGTLICDNGEGSYPAGFNYSEDNEKVVTYIVGGIDGGYSNQYSLYSNYPNMVTLDLSRTTINKLYISGEREALKEVILPSTFNEFSKDAMKAVKLQTLTCFAVTPPELYIYREYDWDTGQYIDKEQRVFYDCPDMVVRVPRESVPLYQAAFGWNEFTILPVDQNYVNLTVRMMDDPKAETLEKYKNMTLLLTNLGTGQVRRLLMNGRNEYEFRYLPQQSNYSLSLQNARGNEAARIDNIFMGDENRQMTLTELKSPRSISLTYTADGTPVAEADLQTTWYNTSREYMARGGKLPEVFDGQQLLCTTTLSDALASSYQQPDTLTLTVGAPYDMVVPLQPLEVKNVTFTVVDSLSGQGIEKAVVQVAHMLPGGKTGRTTTLTTAANGVVSDDVVAAPSLITVTSPIHGSKTLQANLAEAASVDISFVPAEGTCVQVAHTFRPAAAEGVTAQVEPTYSEGRSLEYTFTATLPGGGDSIISQYLASYPLFTFYTQLPAGAKLRVDASSPTGSIEPVTAEATVGEENTVVVTLPVVERGQIEATYMASESKKSALLVIDKETGQVVRRQAFETGEKTTTVTDLQPGNYIVAAMSQGMQYSSITTLQQLEQYEADKDYASVEVTVADGVVSQAQLARIPLCTAQLETNLSERRASFGNAVITVGYYAGMTVKVQFKDLVERTWWNRNSVDKDKYPTNCKLEIYLPEGFKKATPYRTYRSYKFQYSHAYGGALFDDSMPMTLEELEKEGRERYPYGSDLLQTKADYSWDEAERKMTIDWPYIDQGGKMQLSMTPTLAGDFRPEMYLTYTLEGRQYREMLDTEQLTVTRSGIEVPELVIRPTLQVSGKAMYIDETEESATPTANARGRRVTHAAWTPDYTYYEVTVMDGDQPIGRAKIDSEGKWKTTCTLANATSLSKHNVYAKISYTNGISYQTEAKTVTYDPNAIVPLQIRMSFFNHHPVHLVDETVVFDIEHHEARPKSYGYSNEEGYNTDFTFEINLSNNDTTKVYACDLYIQTQGPDAEEFTIPAHYNARKDRWIAYYKFNTRSLPYDVNAIPYYFTDNIGSRQDVEESMSLYDTFTKPNAAHKATYESIEQMFEQLEHLIASGDGDASMDLTMEIARMLNIPATSGGTEMEDYDAAVADEAAETAAIDELINMRTYMDDILGDKAKNLNEIGSLLKDAVVGTADGMTEQQLEADGYQKMMLDNGGYIFQRALDNGSLSVVSLSDNLSITFAASANTRGTAPRSWSDIQAKISEFWGYISDLNGYLSEISNYCDVIIQGLDIYLKNLSAEQSKLMTWFNITQHTNKLSKLEKAALNLTRMRKISAIGWKTSIANQVKAGFSRFKFGDGIGTISGIISLVSDYRDMAKKIDNLVKLNNSLPAICRDDQARCDQLSADIMSFTDWTLVYNIAKITGDLVSIGGAVASLAGCASIVAAPEGLAGLGCSLALMGLNWAGGKIFDSKFSEQWSYFVNEKRQLQCNKAKKKEEKKNCKKDCGDGGTGGSDGTLDPSGYVYEGIPSNRLEGVTATVFFRTVTKNQWGDDVERSVLWNAEDYAQINPQITDENGEYGWMVPAGMWQVKYEKPGYRTEYSEWLPVPPPQLDVNQAMVQYSEPMVSNVKATPKAVFINFDKFMLTDSLNTSTIFVSQGGKQVEGTVEMQIADSTSAQVVSSVRFVPATQLPAGQTLTLTVSRNVTSYAGVQMGQDFTQDFDIVASVESLVSDSALHVIYDQTFPLTVQALPAAVAAGKKVKVKMLSDMIATADATELTLDDAGQATLNITGEAHGTTAVVLSMQDDSDVQSVTVVNVKDEKGFTCPMPEPNYMDESVLEEGTLISLTCELPEAVIYYTTDGTCPCNSPTTQLYVEPIALEGGSMTLKAYAVAPGYMDSEIAEFMFYTTGIVTLPEGTRVVREGTYNILGQRIPDTQRLGKGIYIINGKKVVVR